MKINPFLLLFLCPIFSSLHAQEKTLGDLNGDGVVNLLDTVLMVNHIQGTEFITNSEVLKWQADVNGDGLVNSFDVEDSLEFVFKREPQKQMPLTSVLSTSPYHGEGDIALTREFVVRFNMPLKEGSVITPEMFYAVSSGDLQVTSARLSSDRMKATLFLNGFRWPSNSNVTITFDGSSLTDFMDRPIDLDGDGEQGGVGVWTFSTLAVEASDPSTVVKGRVLDSDNSEGEKALEGVIVSVVGNEEQWTVLTDANGEFRLTSAPIGRFFVVVDGRLVSGQPGETLASNNWKERDYYTFVGKAWEAVPGKEVNATKYGTYNEDGSYNSDPRDGNIYLPLVKKGALQTLNPNEETEVAFASGYLDEASPEQIAMLEATSITIPPGSLQSDDGSTGGSVGIAPVDPDRLPEPLPESLAMPLVITIQTDGPTNFDVPVPARFPNVDNLPPGAKSALWSFDHDTGVWEISGPMTVSEDGKYLESDPGVGIRQPGWHGSAPGAQIFGRAVTTGPSVNQPKQAACGVSHANMDLTENEYTSLGRLSEGIEESIFGANDDEISFAGQILPNGLSFANGKNLSGTSWDLFREHAHKDAKIHSTIARTASSLLSSDDFWNAFATTATTMRDNAISAAIDSSKHSAITQAHLVFLQKLEQTQLSISDQLEKWGEYSIALNGLTGPTSEISGHSVIQTDREELASAIDATLLAYRALPGGRNRLDGHLKRFAESWEAFLASTLDGNLHAYKGESFVFLKRIGSEREENRTPPIAAQRIRVGQGGAYDAIVRPNSWYEAWMLEPTTLVIGCTTFISPQNGGNGPVPPIPLCSDDQGDSDYDYLSDRGERVVGTHKNNKDTDGDRIPDGYEILNGTDPSGGNPVFTGVLATVPPTNSSAFSDFVTTGNDLAILGNGPHGVDIFEIGSGYRPIKLSSFDTPGSVRKAALTQDYLAVADAGAGLTVLDITDPENPALHLSIAQESPANAIATAGKIAFVGLENGTVKSYDLFSGQQIDELLLDVPSGSKGVEDLAWANNQLYALTDSPYYRQWGSWRSKVHSLPSKNGRFGDDEGPFLPREEVSCYGYRPYKNGRKLFVGDQFAYVADIQGFNHIDLSIPDEPGQPTRIKTNSIGWRQIVSNGSGMAVTAEAATYRVAGDVSTYTTDSDGSLYRTGGFLENFETTFPTSGDSRSVSIYNGLAYVADGSSGLQVVNYRSYDINGESPELEVTLDDMDGVVEEAKFLTLRAFVFDDVQVKNVDFFVDGEKVFVDGGYPFAHTLEVPLRKDQATLRLRVVARDTGGNEAYWPGPGSSDEHVLEIRDDLIAPEVVTYIPREGETVFPSDTVITIFNERMDPETIHVRSVRLYEVNEDHSLSAVELESVQYDDATQSAYAQLPAGIKPATYRLIANELATDLAGNPLSSPAPERTFYGPGELKGKLWFDLNHNTLHDDNEETLSDWTVYLDYNNNGERDPGEPNATTDESGQYTFSSLLPGGYAVAEEVPYGWVQTFPKNQSLGSEEVFTNTGWVYEGDNHGGSILALDTLGNAWTAGIVPEGNFTIGGTFFDGNNTEGILYIARIAPTGQVDRVETLGVPDGNNTGIASNLLLKADQDGGVWLSGAYEGSLLAVNGVSLDSNNTTASFLARFNQDFNATYLNSFPGISISSLSTDLDGRLALAGTFNGDVSLGEHSLSSTGGSDAFIAKLASTGSVVWAHALGGDTNETAESVLIDSKGNTWVAGDSDSADFAASSNSLDLSGDAGGYLALYNAEGDNLWAIDPVGGLSVTDGASGGWFLDQNGSEDVVKFVDTNGTLQATFSISGATVGLSNFRSQNLIATEDGNVLICLNTPSGFITINGETLMSGVDNQATLAKLKTNGQIAWSLPITTGSSFLWSLARGSDEYVWALGSVSGSAGETLSLGEYSVSLSGSTGILLKVDPTGEVAGLWSTAPASEVLVDPNDNVWVTGTYQGDAGQEHTLSIGQLSLTGDAANSRFLGRIGKAGSDYHSVQLNPGSVVSDLDFGNSLPLIETRTAMCIGGPDEDASRSVVTDPAGNGYYAGDFTGYTEFGGKRLESDGQNDAMFVKFLPGGKIAWAQNFGGDGDDLGHAIFADDNGSLFACGTFQGTAQFGDFELVSAGMRDIFVLRLDDNGSPLWAFRAGGPEDDDALTLVSDSNNSVYIGGSIQETADFGDYQLQSRGSQDAYVLHLDYNGSVQWVASFMSHDRAEVRTLTLDQNNLPVVAGDFADVLELRGTGEADDQASYFSFSGEDTASEDTNEATDQTFTITAGVYSLSEGEYVDTGRILTFHSHEECQVWSRSATADEHSDETHDHWNAAGDVFYDEINRTFTWTEYGPELDAATVEELCINKTDGVTKTIDEDTYYQDKVNLYLKITSIVSNDDQAEDSSESETTADPVESIDTGLIAYYPFDGNASDMSGNGNDANITSASLTSDRMGVAYQALQFDGEDDWLTIPTSSNFDSLTSYSITVWAKVSDFSANYNPIVSLRTGNDSAFEVYGGNGFTVAHNRNHNLYQYHYFDAYPSGRWTHIAIAYGEDGTLHKFVDGRLETTVSDFTAPNSLTADIQIGRSSDDPESDYYSLLTGSLDELRIYNHAISPTDVRELFLDESGITLSYSLDGSLPEGSVYSAIETGKDRSGFLGQALQLSESSGSIVLPDYNASDKWTVSFWVKPELSLENNQSHLSLNPELDLTFSLDAGDNLYLSIDDQNDSTPPLTSSAISLASLEENNGWLHLSLSRQLRGDGADSQVVASSGKNSFFVKDDGSLWGMGSNEYGQLGIGSNSGNQYTPVQIIDSGVSQVSTNSWEGVSTHALFINDDGSLWGMGSNDHGELGIGNTLDQYTPVQIVDSGVMQVCAGYWYSLFVKDDGSLWGMGNNSNGRLGIGSNSGIQHTPVQIVDLDVLFVSTQINHSVFIKEVGSLWGFGYNHFGMLGIGNTLNQYTPTLIIDSGIVSAAAGGYATLYIKEDGSLWGMGSNEYGQLGIGSNSGNQHTSVQIVDSGVSLVAGGSNNWGETTNLFVKEDGSLWGMGNNSNGQLGIGSNLDNQYTPVQIIDSGIMMGGNTGGTNSAYFSLFINGEEKVSGGLQALSDPQLALTGQSFTGSLDDYSLFDHRLKEAEVNAIYLATLTTELTTNPKMESAGQTDIFVARLDSNGEVLESTQGSGTGIDSVNGIALGKYDEFYLTGVYGPALDLGETSTSGDSTIVNAFHAQLDNNLSTQWISTVGGGGFNRGESVAVDTKGRAYFVGSYTGTAHFEEKSLTARGGADAYLVEYDYRGNVLRLISHGGDAGDAGTAIALDNNGGIIMTGTYQQEAHIFDGEHICHEHGGTDVFVARYDYGIQEPETHFVVEVMEDDNGTEIILINDEPAPTLELIPGLEYTFELDTNTTEEHPFVIVEEGDGGSDLWEVEEDVNQTENIITIKIDEDTPIDLGYGSETEEGLGGEIEVMQDPKPSYRLTIAQYDDGSNNVDGADIRVFKNGQEVSLDEPFEEGTRLRVQLDPSDEFIFEGWQGDLPADANRSFSQDRTFVVTMDQDRTLKAYFSTLSPDDPRDFLDRIEFFIQAKEVDEFGQETGESKPPYAIVFEVDSEGVSEDGTSGSITIVSNGPDFDEPADGVSDRVRGRFIFEQTDEAEGVFQIVQAEAKLSSTNQWSEIWGGGMEMSILFRKDGATSGEAGQFVMIKNDGSTEQGDWDADEIREDFSLNEL